MSIMADPRGKPSPNNPALNDEDDSTALLLRSTPDSSDGDAESSSGYNSPALGLGYGAAGPGFGTRVWLWLQWFVMQVFGQLRIVLPVAAFMLIFEYTMLQEEDT